MATVNSSILVGSKGSGLALIVGFVLTLVAGLFFPGGPFVSPVNQMDFAAAVVPLGEHPSLAHLMTMLVIVGMMLYAYGICAFLRLGNGERSLAGTALRTGVFASLFGWGVFIIGLGHRHMVIHLMQRSLDPAESPEMQAEFAHFAVAGLIDMSGLLMAFVWIYPIASILVGIGLLGRLRDLNILKLASYVLVICGTGSLVNFVVAQHASGLDVEVLLAVNNFFQMIGGVCLLLIGLGLFQGRSGLVPEEEAAG